MLVISPVLRGSSIVKVAVKLVTVKFGRKHPFPRLTLAPIQAMHRRRQTRKNVTETQEIVFNSFSVLDVLPEHLPIHTLTMSSCAQGLPDDTALLEPPELIQFTIL